MSGDKKTFELQIQIATQEAAKAVADLEDEIQGLADEAERFSGSSGEGLQDSFQGMEGAAQDAAQGIDKIVSSIGKLAEVAVLTRALSAIRDLGTFALATADNFQTARNELGMLLGDMDAGAGLFNELHNMRSPFDISTLTQATNALVGANVPLNDLQAQLTRFGDLAQGNAQRFASFTQAFSQAAARGRADIRILNAYLNEGVPILDALARNLGVTASEIVDMANKGKISFADLSQALEDLTAAGGQFYGSMALASQSLAATQQELSEAVNLLAASFGQMLLPAATAVVRAMTDITQAVNESPILKGLFAGALVTLTAALAAKAVRATMAFAAQMKLNLAVGALNPLVMAATVAVGALAAGFTVMAAGQQRAAREAENFAFRQRQQRDALEATRASVVLLSSALRDMADAHLDRGIELTNRRITEARERIGELQSIYAGVVASGHEGAIALVRDELTRENERLEVLTGNLYTALGELGTRRTEWIDSMFGATQAGRVQRLNEQLALTQRFLAGSELPGTDRSRLQEIVASLTEELDRATGDIERTAARWRQAWEQTWDRFQAEQSLDPFAVIELERGKRLADAWNNYLRDANRETHDQINAYFNAQRSETIRQLAEEEARILRELNGSRIEALNYEESRTLESISRLETQRVIAAGDSEAEIAAIRERFAELRLSAEARYNEQRREASRELQLEEQRRFQYLREMELEEMRIRASLSGSRIQAVRYETERTLDAINRLEQRRIIEAANTGESITAISERFAAMRTDLEMQFTINVDKAQLEEAREAVKDWQRQLADSFVLALLDMERFGGAAAAVIGDLSAHLAALGNSSALTGFEAFGRALGEGKDAADSLQTALAAMAQQILRQLPMMFLQAGLQLIASGQWPLGLGFIAAAGSAAVTSGFVDGASQRARQEAQANATGGVYDRHGRAAQAFAAGGAFTNQIVSAPTCFRHGGGLGLMGEAGPEAIVPLKRMPSGSLGVQADIGAGSRVVVNIINHSGASVSREERSQPGGGREIDIIIGDMVGSQIAHGRYDSALESRFEGLRLRGR